MSIIGQSVDQLFLWRNGLHREDGQRVVQDHFQEPLALRKITTFGAGVALGLAGIVSSIFRAIGTIFASPLLLSTHTAPFYQTQFVDLRNEEAIGGCLTIAYSILQIFQDEIDDPDYKISS